MKFSIRPRPSIAHSFIALFQFFATILGKAVRSAPALGADLLNEIKRRASRVSKRALNYLMKNSLEQQGRGTRPKEKKGE
jgi:hypothetical protein